MALTVNEIFHSIQGESSFSGKPCVFIRLTGCNLRCSYCDTQYAYDKGSPIEINEIIRISASYKCPLIEITGGEPLIQEETPALIRHLLDGGYQVLVETNGSQDIGITDDRCIRIVDIKCPSSGEHKSNDLENLFRLTDRDEIKFIIGDRNDYKFAKEILDLFYYKSARQNTIHFSPVSGILPPDRLVKWIMKDHLNVRLNLQLHKIIWPHKQRGV